jgi:hypothetical protein
VGNFPCLNCKTEVSQEKAKVFAGVFVCPDCYTKAERLYNKCEGELKQLLLVLKEAIRVALVKGALQYNPASPLDEVPKDELLEMIVKLTEKKDASSSEQPQVSGPPRR